jgi:glycerol-3-phosphate cytidylyltransferase-like family protein
MTFQERCRVVKSLSFVDEVIAEDSWKQKENDIKKYGVNMFFALFPQYQMVILYISLPNNL